MPPIRIIKDRRGRGLIIYVDVLIIINFMIDFIIIRLAALFSELRVSPFKCAFGAFIGALSSLVVFVPVMSSLSFLVFKVAICIIMAAVSFAPIKPKKLFKATAVLFMIGFIFSGVFTFISESVMRDKMSVYRGTVYLDIGFPAMLLSVISAYISVRFLTAIFKNRVPSGVGCSLTIVTKYGSCTTDAIIDTGCSVTEPFSGEPVVICDSKLVFSIVPHNFFEGTNFRLVPFKTINGTGMLKAFRSEYIIVLTDKHRYRKEGVFIAAGEIDGFALINPMVLNNSNMEGAFT